MSIEWRSNQGKALRAFGAANRAHEITGDSKTASALLQQAVNLKIKYPTTKAAESMSHDYLKELARLAKINLAVTYPQVKNLF
jgi:hypothetical protein